MKRQTLISLNIMIASIMVFVFMLQVKKTSANDANFTKALLSQSNHQSGRVATDATPTMFTEGMENSLPIESLVIPATPEQLKKNETIIKGARALIKQAEAAYRLTGWWHSSFQNYLIPSNFEDAKLPNGLSMPTEWKEDHWMLIDKDGYVIKEVNIQDTGSPETSQIGTFKDSIMTIEV